jgi:hypothetical protein
MKVKAEHISLIAKKGLEKEYATLLLLKPLYKASTIMSYNEVKPTIAQFLGVCVQTLDKYIDKLVTLGWAEKRFINKRNDYQVAFFSINRLDENLKPTLKKTGSDEGEKFYPRKRVIRGDNPIVSEKLEELKNKDFQKESLLNWAVDYLQLLAVDAKLKSISYVTRIKADYIKRRVSGKYGVKVVHELDKLQLPSFKEMKHESTRVKAPISISHEEEMALVKMMCTLATFGVSGTKKRVNNKEYDFSIENEKLYKRLNLKTTISRRGLSKIWEGSAMKASRIIKKLRNREWLKDTPDYIFVCDTKNREYVKWLINCDPAHYVVRENMSDKSFSVYYRVCNQITTEHLLSKSYNGFGKHNFEFIADFSYSVRKKTNGYYFDNADLYSSISPDSAIDVFVKAKKDIAEIFLKEFYFYHKKAVMSEYDSECDSVEQFIVDWNIYVNSMKNSGKTISSKFTAKQHNFFVRLNLLFEEIKGQLATGYAYNSFAKNVMRFCHKSYFKNNHAVDYDVKHETARIKNLRASERLKNEPDLAYHWIRYNKEVGRNVTFSEFMEQTGRELKY